MIFVALLFGLALVAPLVVRLLGRAAAPLLAVGPLAVFGAYASRAFDVRHGEAFVDELAWLPELGIAIAMRLDGLSLLFALLITGIGGVVVLYSGAYLDKHPLEGRLFAYLLAFMASMLGLVLADDLVLLYVFWELTSVTSFLLIGFDHEREEARRSAWQALLVTVAGGLALLAGVLLLGQVAGTYSMSELGPLRDRIVDDPLYPALLGLLLAGAFTKSAQFPFHFWLPNAMVAPTPVSAYLHSATMVKAGIYLLARLGHVLGDTPEWVWALTVVGGITMVLGAVLALRDTDMKRILAYSTIMALGMLTVLLGLGFEESIKAAVVFLIVHSLYKAALFLVAGALDHSTGTRDVTQLGGLAGAMPLTFAAALLAALSMAGLPPLFGFIGKELTFEAKLGVGFGEVVFPVAAIAANALTVTAAVILVVRPFFGRRRGGERAREVPAPMWVGPVILGLMGGVMGAAPTLFSQQVVEAAMQAVAGSPSREVSLSPWPGLTPELALSGASWTAGVVIYLLWDRLRPALDRAAAVVGRIGPERAYQSLLAGVLALGRLQTRWIVHGRLGSYMLLTAGVVLALVGGAALRLEGLGLPLGGSDVTAWALAAVVVACAGLAGLTASRVVAVAAMVGAGFGIAALFAMVGAPDLAVTQLLADSLILVVLLLMAPLLGGLRAPGARRSPPGRVVGRAVALALGAAVSAALLGVLAVPFDATTRAFYGEQALPRGHGHNIVNVILVQFRALDTLGEIVVVAVAVLGAVALLRSRRERRPS